MPQRITSGRPWETRFKYSRAIRYGNFDQLDYIRTRLVG